MDLGLVEVAPEGWDGSSDLRTLYDIWDLHMNGIRFLLSSAYSTHDTSMISGDTLGVLR